MTTKVINIKNAPLDWENDPQYVYIGRGSIYGNPYPIGGAHPRLTGQPMTRDDVCDLFEEKVLPDLCLSGNLFRLRGRTLVCFCKPLRCHGDSLVKEIDRE